MKITIFDIPPGGEEEIIVKCSYLDDELVQLLRQFGQGSSKLNVFRDGKIYLITPEEIYYFESVEEKVFAYCSAEVYEIKSKLYLLEQRLPERDFLRISKSTILNLNKIGRLSPAFGGRFEALLQNGEKVMISRQYVGRLKEALGL